MSLSLERYASPSPPPHTSATSATSQPPPPSADMSPSTTASSQPPQPALTASTTSLPTPASSVTDLTSSSTRPKEGPDADGDVPMKHVGEEALSAQQGHIKSEEEVMVLETIEHRRTDHERQASTTSPADHAGTANVTSDVVDQKPHANDVDTVMQPTESEPELDRLRGDVGSPYLLRRTHLLALYKLQPLVATVARNDPVTGEKRALRKTYKGKIKDFGLAGRDKEVIHPEDQPGSLLEMAQWPQEEWQVQKVAGKELQTGFSPAMLAKLDRAVKMEAGSIPGFDASILGLDPPAPVVMAKKPIPQGTNLARTSALPNGTSTAAATSASTASSEPPRPKRSNKKRRYDEHSFEGYGEGFVDDDMEMGGGYSSSDREDARRGSSGKKKRKKVGPTGSDVMWSLLTFVQNADSYGSIQSPGLLERGGSYGVGMVGVGSGGYGGR
ncbi:MAG: hypothetical protein M1817_006874 [Caeruleum heppii]|nr:MAG: hypothetical protein M1817_006874 [Caeruleum heppii]